MRDFLLPIKASDVIQSGKVWRETTMETEHGVFNDSCHGKKIKNVSEVLPHVASAELSQTFIVKTIHLSNISRFVVAAQNHDSAGVTDF